MYLSSNAPSPSMSIPVTRMRFTLVHLPSNDCQSRLGHPEKINVFTLAKLSSDNPVGMSCERYCNFNVVRVRGRYAVVSGAPCAKFTLSTCVPLASRYSSFVWLLRSNSLDVLLPVFACAWLRTLSRRSDLQALRTSHQPVEPLSDDCRLSSRNTSHLPRSKPFFKWSAAPVMSSIFMRLAPYIRIGSLTVNAPDTLKVATSPSSTIPVLAMFGELFVP